MRGVSCDPKNHGDFDQTLFSGSSPVISAVQPPVILVRLLSGDLLSIRFSPIA
jgi:hypothetical protein